MKRSPGIRLVDWWALVLVMSLTGCATTPHDYAAYRAHMPRSILVLPPINESIDANATYSYLTTVTKPVAERGYYVFPVAVVDEFMKDNGLPTPADMHNVSLAKIAEVIGPDAVLYITIEDFGQKFLVLTSETRVDARARMVDVATGTEIWSGEVRHRVGSNSSGNIVADIVAAAIIQVAEAATDQTHEAARQANHVMVNDSNDGLLIGPLHPEYGQTTQP